MIGILLISHSPQIAQGVQALAGQMTKGQVRIAAAGGTLEGELGTSADLIGAAIAELVGVEAILALVDLGSAVMSAEMALELAGVPFRISGAALVEGALVAAVEATRPGATLDEIAAAAARALESKNLPDLPQGPPAPAAVAPPALAAAVEATLTIGNKVGLHMRPAKEFVQTASRFKAAVRVRNLERPERPEGNAKSMIDVMKLGVAFGHRISLRAEGEDAEAAVAAITALVANNFGE